MASKFKASDVKDASKLRDLLMRISEDPSVMDELPEEELLKIEHLVGPMGTVPECNVDGAAEAWSCVSFINIRKEYFKRFITTTMIGYLYRRCDEFGRNYQETVDHMDDMKEAEKNVMKAQRRLATLGPKIIAKIRERDELQRHYDEGKKKEKQNEIAYASATKGVSQEQLMEWREFRTLVNDTKQAIRIANKAIDDMEEERETLMGIGKRFIIKQFLDEQFNFNPDKHVRASYSDQKASTSGEVYISKFIPPKDTFHNFQYYMDSNYEELSGVTQHLYGLAKTDLDVAILPCGVFPSLEEADDFVQRNKDLVISDIRTLKVGKWNLIEAYKANRDAIEAYRGTIVEDILEQVKEDTKIGSELTINRVTKRRREKAKKTRPPPEMVRNYIAERGEDISDKSVDTSKLSPEERETIYEKYQAEKLENQRELVELDDRRHADEVDEEPEEVAPHDALRVNVFNFSGGGKDLKKNFFYTKAKKPEKPSHSQ